jgi:hypothetical protein
MRFRFLTLVLVFTAALFCPASAGGKADRKAAVSFHIQTDENENPKMLLPPQEMNGRTLYFRRMPEVYTKDLTTFSPFPAEGGGDYGAVFRLKGSAVGRLAAITSANQGRWLAAMVNGRIVDGVLINKQIDDGVLVVWKGLNIDDIAAIEQTLTRFGAEDGKKKK